jgi:SsrA-binding protein
LKQAKERSNHYRKVLAQNRRARHDYEILDVFEAGIVLTGSEVKSLRQGHAQLRDSYARIQDHEVWVYKLVIPVYSHSGAFGSHVTDRPRKLLMHRDEIDRLAGRVEQARLTLVPLSLYLSKGLVKLELALAKGKTLYDKRHALAERDAQMEMKRLKARYRG